MEKGKSLSIKLNKIQYISINTYIYVHIYIRGLHLPDFSDRTRPGPHGYNLCLARPEVKKKFRPGPGPVRKRY